MSMSVGGKFQIFPSTTKYSRWQPRVSGFSKAFFFCKKKYFSIKLEINPKSKKDEILFLLFFVPPRLDCEWGLGGASWSRLYCVTVSVTVSVTLVHHWPTGHCCAAHHVSESRFRHKTDSGLNDLSSHWSKVGILQGNLSLEGGKI